MVLPGSSPPWSTAELPVPRRPAQALPADSSTNSFSFISICVHQLLFIVCLSFIMSCHYVSCILMYYLLLSFMITAYIIVIRYFPFTYHFWPFLATMIIIYHESSHQLCLEKWTRRYAINVFVSAVYYLSHFNEDFRSRNIFGWILYEWICHMSEI